MSALCCGRRPGVGQAIGGAAWHCASALNCRRPGLGETIGCATRCSATTLDCYSSGVVETTGGQRK